MANTAFWGPYLSNRQWGTVREDRSLDGNSWASVSYDEACNMVYKWGEDGLFGYCDMTHNFCMCLGLWNGQDHILKERLFGLTGPQGNHGEDIKELLYYLDGTPDHSYMKALYKYPYVFPYHQLIQENKARGPEDPEFEIMDTGVFDRNEYFDVEVEYSRDKDNARNLCCCYTITNRGETEKELYVIPQFWFRNRDAEKSIHSGPYDQFIKYTDSVLEFQTQQHGKFVIEFTETNDPEVLLTDNAEYFGYSMKSSFHGYIIDGHENAIRKGFDAQGTKCGILYKLTLSPDEVKSLYWSIEIKSVKPVQNKKSIAARIEESRQNSCKFRQNIFPILCKSDWKEEILQQAFGGLLWNKQFYSYQVLLWQQQRDLLMFKKICMQYDLSAFHRNLRLDSYEEFLAMKENLEMIKRRLQPLDCIKLTKALDSLEEMLNRGSQLGGNWYCKDRNSGWEHLDNYDIMLMPDKWEFPWYASWDTAFMMIPYSRVDPDFAERQMQLYLSDKFMHPNGQIPGCEWNLSDVFPPVHAWGCLKIYDIRKQAGNDDKGKFLSSCYTQLQRNFTWWIENMRIGDTFLFSGGFLGMDNISVIDRSYVLQKGFPLQQADATGWMAMFALAMMRMAAILSFNNPQCSIDTVTYLNHFLRIAEDLNKSIARGGLWHPHDKFYYDVCSTATRRVPIRVRSLVGIIPWFAGINIKDTELKNSRRLSLALQNIQPTSAFIEKVDGMYKLSAVPKARQRDIVHILFNEEEFLSPYGIRSLSKVYAEEPYILPLDKDLKDRLCVTASHVTISYAPGESNTRMFGGNSNWRGPVWMCMNYLVIDSLLRSATDTFLFTPLSETTVSSHSQVAAHLMDRIIALFCIDKHTGLRPCHGSYTKYKEAGWNNLIQFFEYFDGDTGRGCGASHQTGWTSLVIELLINKFS